VVGDVAATVDLVERDATACKEIIGSKNVVAVGVAAEGEHRRMLEEQQDIADAALLAQVDKFHLETESFAVVDAA
jgi:hypothetical protein